MNGRACHASFTTYNRIVSDFWLLFALPLRALQVQLLLDLLGLDPLAACMHARLLVLLPSPASRVSDLRSPDLRLRQDDERGTKDLKG